MLPIIGQGGSSAFAPLSQLGSERPQGCGGPPHQGGRFEKLANWLFVSSQGPPFLLVRSFPFSVARIEEAELRAVQEFLAAGRPSQWPGAFAGLIDSLRRHHFFDGEPEPGPNLNRHVSAILLVSYHCNLTCAGCFASGGSYGMERSHMRLEVIDATIAYLVRQLRALYIGDGYQGEANLGLHFFGGEPFVAFDRIRYGVQRASHAAAQLSQELRRHVPTDFFVTTNGTLMTRDRVEFLRQNNFTVMLSIDGPDHDSRRPYASGKGSLTKVLEAYRALRAAGVKIRINTVLLPEDLGRARAVAEWFKTNVYRDASPHTVWHTFSFQREGPALTVGSQTKAYAPTLVAQFIEVLLELRRLGYQVFEPDLAAKAQMGGTFYKCSSGVKRIAIGPDGKVYPCQGFIHESKALGSILDPQFDHRATPVSREMRERNIATLHPCRDCVFSALCPHQVDCAARAHYTLGGITHIEVDGMCRVGYELMYDTIFTNNCTWLSNLMHNPRMGIKGR